MIRELIQAGHPALKAKNKQVTDFNAPEIKQLITDLTETMHDAGLVGIAAPQIAENYLAFVTEPRQTDTRPADQADELRVYFNPRIVASSKEKSIIYEGCGSIARGTDVELFGPVSRPREITVEAYDENGDKFQLRCDGLLARVIQHEYDHIHGIEYIEKVSDYSKMVSKEHYMNHIKQSQEQTENSIITIKEYKKLT